MSEKTLIEFGLSYERALEVAWSLSEGLKQGMVTIGLDQNSKAVNKYCVYVKTEKPIVIVSGGLVQEIKNVPIDGILVFDFDTEISAPDYVSVQEYN